MPSCLAPARTTNKRLPARTASKLLQPSRSSPPLTTPSDKPMPARMPSIVLQASLPNNLIPTRSAKNPVQATLHSQFFLFPPICIHSSLGYGLCVCALLLFICARAPSMFHIFPFRVCCPLYAFTLPSMSGNTLARCSFHRRDHPLHFSYMSLPLLSILPIRIHSSPD